MQSKTDLGNGVLVDVRTPDEHAAGALPGAHLMPIDSLSRYVGQLQKLTYGRRLPVYVYCRKGIRARKAVIYLRKLGFDARNIGGIEVQSPAKTFFDSARQGNPSLGLVVGGLAVGGGLLFLAADLKARHQMVDGRHRGMSYQIIYDPGWERRGEGDGKWEWNAVGIEIGNATSKAKALAKAKSAIDERLDGPRKDNPCCGLGHLSTVYGNHLQAQRAAEAVRGAQRHGNPSEAVMRRVRSLNGLPSAPVVEAPREGNPKAKT